MQRGAVGGPVSWVIVPVFFRFPLVSNDNSLLIQILQMQIHPPTPSYNFQPPSYNLLQPPTTTYHRQVNTPPLTGPPLASTPLDPGYEIIYREYITSGARASSTHYCIPYKQGACVSIPCYLQRGFQHITDDLTTAAITAAGKNWQH